MPKPLTLAKLQSEAAAFAKMESKHDEPSLYGVTDGKAVALQWRLQYSRVIAQAGQVDGIKRLA